MTLSPIWLPYAPAFIYTAPPKFPGIPDANSKPVSSFSNETLAIFDKRTPAPAFNISFSFSILLKSIFTTIPLIPLSATSTLLPFPITVTCTLCSFAKANKNLSSSVSFTFTKISAGPPYFKCCMFFHRLV